MWLDIQGGHFSVADLLPVRLMARVLKVAHELAG
jgi:hypothetical protein